MKAGARAPQRKDLLLLGLANARTAVRYLEAPPHGAAPAASNTGTLPEDPADPALRQIISRGVAGDLDLSPAATQHELELVTELAERLLQKLEAPLRQARAVRRKAWVRALAPPLLVAIACATLAWPRLVPLELSADKPWTTSSIGLVCDPAHKSCGGSRTAILFHTALESEPWFEIDLGAAQEITGAVVRNRSDCCAESAVPLKLEVSVDHVAYRTLAHKFTVFDEWAPTFPPTLARYVRLRVQRRSMLHLESVRVFGHRAPAPP
jgi:hypothetical protein